MQSQLYSPSRTLAWRRAPLGSPSGSSTQAPRRNGLRSVAGWHTLGPQRRDASAAYRLLVLSPFSAARRGARTHEPARTHHGACPPAAHAPAARPRASDARRAASGAAVSRGVGAAARPSVLAGLRCGMGSTPVLQLRQRQQLVGTGYGGPASVVLRSVAASMRVGAHPGGRALAPPQPPPPSVQVVLSCAASRAWRRQRRFAGRTVAPHSRPAACRRRDSLSLAAF
ncbi:hypothetical protein PsYK624_072440 [Phanerochaete sordida]|uniref:Uncharacterized protein n=1 Tax=Phanerochaete sordida TaxID=48140 RepID=A0A9P3GBZ9_9APHY|nr:hypothetical protein PsYK624_072440 [Phanerochaete sordida]